MQLIGQILGDRYRLEKKIGEGGMGQVFRARDIMTGEIVAVKILKEALSLKNTYLRRFKREIRSGSLVNHPGIVKLLDEGSIEGRPYLVMEYVEGQNLRQWAKNKRRSINLILEKFEGICKAIHNAHEKKLIHRDLKPENVLITYMGEVKIMDFGLARKINETSMITSPGTFIGTVVYTSPEQASGKKIDPRCDIYSIGIMLFEMLTGKLPFKGDDPIAVLFQHIHNDPPSVRELNKDVFPELEEFIARILSKDPEKRPQTAYETSREIKKLLNIMRGVSIEESEEILLQHASATPAGEDTELLPRKNYESTASTELKIEKLQGNMEVTFLLIELLDFINFTESLDYPTVQKFLDEYNHRLEDEILRYKVKVIQAGGHKSFYLIINMDESNPAEAAARISLNIKKSLQKLRESSFFNNFRRVPLKIGIETSVISAELVSEENLSKIESRTKVYHTATLIQNLSKAIQGDTILADGDTYEKIKTDFQGELYKKIYVRGRIEPVFVYRIQAE